MFINAEFDDNRFRDLLDHWNHHQALRRSGATIADLAGSRAELDSARLAAFPSRRHPVAA